MNGCVNEWVRLKEGEAEEPMGTFISLEQSNSQSRGCYVMHTSKLEMEVAEIGPSAETGEACDAAEAGGDAAARVVRVCSMDPSDQVLSRALAVADDTTVGALLETYCGARQASDPTFPSAEAWQLVAEDTTSEAMEERHSALSPEAKALPAARRSSMQLKLRPMSVGQNTDGRWRGWTSGSVCALPGEALGAGEAVEGNGDESGGARGRGRGGSGGSGGSSGSGDRGGGGDGRETAEEKVTPQGPRQRDSDKAVAGVTLSPSMAPSARALFDGGGGGGGGEGEGGAGEDRALGGAGGASGLGGDGGVGRGASGDRVSDWSMLMASSSTARDLGHGGSAGGDASAAQRRAIADLPHTASTVLRQRVLHEPTRAERRGFTYSSSPSPAKKVWRHLKRRFIKLDMGVQVNG